MRCRSGLWDIASVIMGLVVRNRKIGWHVLRCMIYYGELIEC